MEKKVMDDYKVLEKLMVDLKCYIEKFDKGVMVNCGRARKVLREMKKIGTEIGKSMQEIKNNYKKGE